MYRSLLVLSAVAAVAVIVSPLTMIFDFFASKECTSQQDLVQYANRVTRGNQMTYNDAAVDSTPRYSNSFEEFTVDHSDVALAVSGASFNAAKVIDHYETEIIPQHKLVSVPKEVTESGILGDYKKTVYVDEYRTLDPIVKKIPIFKEKVITSAKLESIKKFMEAKTLGEVKLLYGSRDKTALEDV